MREKKINKSSTTPCPPGVPPTPAIGSLLSEFKTAGKEGDAGTNQTKADDLVDLLRWRKEGRERERGGETVASQHDRTGGREKRERERK